MKRKNVIVAAATLLICALLAISARLGGKEHRALSELGSETTDGAGEMLKKYRKKLKEQPDSVILKHNLAYFHFRLENYNEARQLLEELINSGESDKTVVRRAFYNLGNTFFRLSEKEKDFNQAAAWLNKSLEYYRAAIDIEKRSGAYLVSGKENNDARFNHALAFKRLKVLRDELERRKQAQERRKQLYQSLQELFVREKEIKQKLAVLKDEPLSGELVKERDQLLNAREDNLKKFKIIREKIDRYLKTPVPPAKPSVNSNISTQRIFGNEEVVSSIDA